MSLSARDVAALLAEARGSIEGARVEHVHQPDSYGLLLTLRRPGEERAYLHLNVRPGCSRVLLLPSRLPALPAPPPFCETARKCLQGARLVALRQVSGDRVVELSFLRADGGEASLVLEVKEEGSQLALLGPQRRLLAGLPRVRSGGRELEVGDVYRFPASRPSSPTVLGPGESPWRYLGADAGAEPPARWPLHAAFARLYEVRDGAEALREVQERGVAAAKKALARRESTLQKVKADLEAARKGEEHLRAGELLKTVYHRLRRGLEEVEVEDFSTDPPSLVRVRLRPDWTPQENLAWRFKRHQKSRRAIPIIEERITKLEEEVAHLRLLGEQLAAAASLEQAQALAAALEARTARRAGGGSGKGPRATPREGPRVYRSTDGFEILVGRSARKNDELTLKIARGNDWFLHFAGQPGAHVIVRSIPGKTVPLTTLLEAAQLTLFHSVPDRSAALVGRGAAAEVDYTQVKNVRKPRGLKPGAVLLSSHKTLRVSLDRETLERLRSGAEDDGRAGK